MRMAGLDISFVCLIVGCLPYLSDKSRMNETVARSQEAFMWSFELFINSVLVFGLLSLLNTHDTYYIFIQQKSALASFSVLYTTSTLLLSSPLHHPSLITLQKRTPKSNSPTCSIAIHATHNLAIAKQQERRI